MSYFLINKDEIFSGKGEMLEYQELDDAKERLRQLRWEYMAEIVCANSGVKVRHDAPTRFYASDGTSWITLLITETSV